MQQHLDVQLKIQVPPEAILITKVEYTELKQSELSGVYWTMQDLEKRLGRKSEWLRAKILYKFREKLDIANGGFVFYPESQGQQWSFQAGKMAEFLDRHFNSIFKERK